ncbi:MAG: hypothetical protein P1U36_10820 [Legionellaceae bacterium]|nr:hypothetical protein [Legionellaceae bacterium]
MKNYFRIPAFFVFNTLTLNGTAMLEIVDVDGEFWSHATASSSISLPVIIL